MRPAGRLTQLILITATAILASVGGIMLGSHAARAQAGARIIDSVHSMNNNWALDDAGRVWRGSWDGSGVWQVVATIPGGTSIAAREYSSDIVTVVCANGDVFSRERDGMPFIFKTNILSGSPTQSARQTWGQVKTRYR